MSKKFIIAMIAMTFIWIGGGQEVSASATMPTNEVVMEEDTTSSPFTFGQWWEQFKAKDKVEQAEEGSESTEEVTEPSKEEQVESNESLHAFEQEVFTLTNKEREKNGLAPFQLDTKLSEVAREKSNDMAQKGYFDHQSPTYGSPFDMMKQFGVSYQTAGENIAMGQRTPEEVVNAWMNSEGHRANILNENFTHIGVGYVDNGNYWTQQFIGK